MAKHPRKGKAKRAIVSLYKVDQEKKVAFSGADSNIPALPTVNRVCDVLGKWYWAYLRKHGLDSNPTAIQLFTENRSEQSSLTSSLNEALGTLRSSLSQGVPCALEGGEDNPEYELLQQVFADPAAFKAVRKDGQPWEPLSVLIDYGLDKAESTPSA